MRPFVCPVTILNTIDPLGRFDGKVDEGFFIGYSTNSKAFKVFNSRTRIVEENLHVKFSEETPNIAGNGPNWLFDIDALTKSMNYEPVVAENQSNGIAEHDSGNIIRTQSMATLNEPIPQGTGSGSGPKHQDTILGDRPTQTRVLSLENVKTAQDLEITSLKKRVKKLEKKKKARTSQLKRRLFKFQEDAETQWRYDQDIDITTASAPITTVDVSVSTTKPSTPPTTTTTTVIEDEDLIIA
ncbi:retrovirus-related pol polyprotein from transposon TNT 1-94 [Tanacetum coccineum]|uniref:Retrovirus-related pol polyprotein from transposon TNT 1-94 n=1 Tax=Tanacetum coccineum TaxID=301880 RepID=A0ABQ5FEM0_9ASTR